MAILGSVRPLLHGDHHLTTLTVPVHCSHIKIQLLVANYHTNTHTLTHPHVLILIYHHAHTPSHITLTLHLHSRTLFTPPCTHQILVETPVTRGPKGSLRTGLNRACTRCSETHMLRERFSWRLLPQEIKSCSKHSQIALHNEYIHLSCTMHFEDIY